MQAGGIGAGASNHFGNVPQRDTAPQALHPGLVQKDSVQTRNTDGVWSARFHVVPLLYSGIVPTAKHWLKTAKVTIFRNVNRLRGRKKSRHPAAIARRERQAAAERGHQTRQQNEALRRRAHRHDMLAQMEGN